MLVKLDENLSDAHAELLCQMGYECDRVTDEGLSGAPDKVIWQVCCQEQRFFITLDLDFSDIRRFPSGTHPGILLLRPRTRSRKSVLELLAKIIAEYPLTSLAGCLVVADERQTRIRRPFE